MLSATVLTLSVRMSAADSMKAAAEASRAAAVSEAVAVTKASTTQAEVAIGETVI